jgi:hypothetical protein
MYGIKGVILWKAVISDLLHERFSVTCLVIRNLHAVYTFRVGGNELAFLNVGGPVCLTNKSTIDDIFLLL